MSSAIPCTRNAPLPQGEGGRSGETWRVVTIGVVVAETTAQQGVGLMHPRGSLYVVERVILAVDPYRCGEWQRMGLDLNAGESRRREP